MTVSTICPELIIRLVNTHISELGGQASLETSFEDLEVDSLVCVEIAVLLGQQFGVRLTDHEVARSGTFSNLTKLISDRQVGRE
jgi:acyl carrier protein